MMDGEIWKSDWSLGAQNVSGSTYRMFELNVELWR